MGLLSWIIFGLLAGWVASMVTGRHLGCFLNLVVGVVGAFLGGLIMELITRHGFSFRFDPSSFAVAVIGSIILLAIAGLATRKND